MNGNVFGNKAIVIPDKPSRSYSTVSVFFGTTLIELAVYWFQSHLAYTLI